MTPHLTATFKRALARARRGAPTALDALTDDAPVDDADAYRALLAIHALHLAPVWELDGAEWFQHHPAVAVLKARLERRFLADLDEDVRRLGVDAPADDVAARVRRFATANLVPPVYDWLAEEATMPEMVAFLAIEGGPDGGFDDLVAVAQVGIDGPAKLTLAANYWDEMGRGDPVAVHTELHRRLRRALRLPSVAPEDLPVPALRRSVLNGVLATNRALQPEMLGALGILELQAGPRCRRVLAGLTRLGAPADAFPFYAEHAGTDPRHGKEWLEEALAPLAARPGWADRIVRGAAWRVVVSDGLFAVLAEHCTPSVGGPTAARRAS